MSGTSIPFRGARLWKYSPWLLVAGAAIATYLTALPNGFVSDAARLISENPSVLKSDEWLAWFSRPYFWGSHLGDLSLYRPLTVLSYLVTIRLAGPDAFSFMVGNVLLHGAASLLVLAVGRQLVGAHAAVLGALLFAVHPLHTEAVAWIGGRPDLLATVFVLISVLCFLRATEESARRPGLYSALAAGSYFAALLSKEHVITLPVWFVFVWILDRRQPSARWTKAIIAGSLAAILAFMVLETVVAGSLPKSVSLFAGRIGERAWAPWRWSAAVAIAGKYAALFFWPRGLTFDYTLYPALWARLGPPALEVLWGGIVIVGLLATLAWAIRAHRGLALALAFIPVTYAVISSFPFTPQLFIAERFAYLPSAGACLAAGWVLLRMGRRVSGAERGHRRPLSSEREALVRPEEPPIPVWMLAGWRGRTVFCILFGLLGVLAMRSAIRNPEWKSLETLFHAALSVSPDSPQALAAFGEREYKRGDYQGALPLLERSLELNPKRPEPYALLADIYIKRGEVERVIALSRQATAELPQRQTGLIHNLAVLLWQAPRVDQAEALFRQIVTRRPDYFPSRVALGRLLLESGRASEALEEFRVASTVTPGSPWGWFGMARASWALGRREEARAYADRGMRLLPKASSRDREGAPRIVGEEHPVFP